MKVITIAIAALSLLLAHIELEAESPLSNNLVIVHGETDTLLASLPAFKQVFIDAFTRAYQDFTEAELGYTKSQLDRHEELVNNEIDELLGNQNVFCCLAYKNNQLVGWITFDVHNNDCAYIRLICVGPQYMHCGAGKALITSIQERLPKIKQITVDTNRLNANAHAFYEKLGFVRAAFVHHGYDPEHYYGYAKTLEI